MNREGFDNWFPEDFVTFFCTEMRCAHDVVVTRIEWRCLDGGAS